MSLPGRFAQGHEVKRILLVDDEADIVEACTAVLEFEGYSVSSVSDPRQALESARHDRPDLVVLDWVMPWLDGGAVLSQLRADGATSAIPVLVISALSDAAARARAAHADGLLAKPFDADQLTETVAALLDR
jgi:CheY-like chemotaxis protein